MRDSLITKLQISGEIFSLLKINMTGCYVTPREFSLQRPGKNYPRLPRGEKIEKPKHSKKESQ